MRQMHGAGEKLFVDYAGADRPGDRCRQRRDRRAHMFVAVWGASNYTYAEATWARRSADWIAAHVNALDFFGGAPALLVPDNLKALIAEANRYEPEPNRTYRRLAEHYGCALSCRHAHASPETRRRSHDAPCSVAGTGISRGGRPP